MLLLELHQNKSTKIHDKNQDPHLSIINQITDTKQETSQKMCHPQEEAKKMSASGWDGYQCGYCGDEFKKEEDLNEHISSECTYTDKY